MSDYRKYAAGVLISAGLFVTGVMWWQRPSPYIAGEDIAAIMADAWERHAAMRSTGTNGIESAFTGGVWGNSVEIVESNFVRAVRLRYNLELIAETLRRDFYATDYAPQPRWLGSTNIPGSGSAALILHYPPYVPEISTNSATDGSIKTEWTLPAATSAAPAYVTLDARHIDGTHAIWWPYQASEWQGPAPAASRSAPMIRDFLVADHDTNPYPPHGNAWTALGLGSNVYIWPALETVALVSNTVLDALVGTRGPRNYTIYTNALNDFRTVLQAKHAAILIASRGTPPNQWAYDQRIIRASPRDLDPIRYNGPLDDLPYDIDTQARADTTASETSVTNGPGINPLGNLAQVRHHLRFETLKYDIGGPEYTTARGDWATSMTHYHGVRCLWPSAAVYASGLVSRVRYYGVFSGTPLANNVGPTRTSRPFSTAAGQAGTAVHVGEDFGTGYALCVYPPLVLHYGVNAYDVGSESMQPAVWKLTELADTPNPTEPPRVDIGVSSIDIASMSPRSLSATRDYPDPGQEYRITYEYHEHNPSLNLKALICVVDFNFSNYSAGGTATPYTPPWATNAPPLTP